MNANSGKSDTGHDARSGALIWKVADRMFMSVACKVAEIIAFGNVCLGKNICRAPDGRGSLRDP